MLLYFICGVQKTRAEKKQKNIVQTMKRTEDTMTWHSVINSEIDVSETVIRRDWILTFLRVLFRQIFS